MLCLMFQLYSTSRIKESYKIIPIYLQTRIHFPIPNEFYIHTMNTSNIYPERTMTKAQEIRERRLQFKAQKNSEVYAKLKEIRKQLAITERQAPNSALHKGLLMLLLQTKEKLKLISQNRFIVAD